MLERLTQAAEERAAAAVASQISRIAQTPTPPGVAVEANADGVILLGKNLRRRMLTNANLRNFGR